MKLPLGYYLFSSKPYPGAIATFYFGPSRRHTQVCVALHRNLIHIHNNIGGQLGPFVLCILLRFWPPHLFWTSHRYP